MSDVRRPVTRVEASLPWNDDSIARLPDAVRLHIGTYWQGRASAELHVADAFSQLNRLLVEGGGETSVLQLLERSVENEHHHADLCHRLAVRYLGRDLEPPEARVAELPPLDQAPPDARVALHMAGLCCINESIATVWLEQCASGAVAPLARAVTQLHLSDEVVHARVGWAHLASRFVTPATRTEVGRWLVPLLKANVGHWLSRNVISKAGGVPEHALPTRDQHRGAVLGAVRNVVLPGFEHCGVPVAAAWRWFRANEASAR